MINASEIAALRDCFREMRRWGVNLNQTIHALNKIAYELGCGKVPETARILQDTEAATIPTSMRQIKLGAV